MTKYLSGAGTSLLGSFANADPILNRRAENRDFCFTVENVGVMLSWFFIITQECPLNKKMTVHTRKISLRFVISFCSTKLDFSLLEKLKNDLQVLLLQAQGFQMCLFSVHLVESIVSVPRYSLEFIRRYG